MLINYSMASFVKVAGKNKGALGQEQSLKFAYSETVGGMLRRV
jgi:hypothetical protein